MIRPQEVNKGTLVDPLLTPKQSKPEPSFSTIAISHIHYDVARITVLKYGKNRCTGTQVTTRKPDRLQAAYIIWTTTVTDQ